MKTIFCVIAMVFAASVHADMNVLDYLKAKGSDATGPNSPILVFVSGTGFALLTENNILEPLKRQPLFCVPLSKTLDGNDFMRLLDHGVQRISATMTANAVNQTPVSAVILLELMKTYPCTKTP